MRNVQNEPYTTVGHHAEAMQENLGLHGPIQLDDGSVLRLDPPLPFDPDKPMLLDGKPLLQRLLSLDGVPLVIADTAFVVREDRAATYDRYHVSCITNAPELEVDWYEVCDSKGSTLAAGNHRDSVIERAISIGGCCFVQHWTRRPGEKYATPERVWPGG